MKYFCNISKGIALVPIGFFDENASVKNIPAEVPYCRGFKRARLVGEEEIQARHPICNPCAHFVWPYLVVDRNKKARTEITAGERG